ncbi:hypothetical protein RND81_07G022100 [Saponaria officinalis]|uniref:DNA-directed RNA polymerase n=1 Tax=Saponaria officinalis TaxID=3572 RepID=A0AAW1JLK7_SAPOF
MPVSMKIQPIDAVAGDSDTPAVVPPAVAAKPVVKSRLRRLFRISGAAEKDELPAATAVAATEQFEPSSVCLAKMVQNFIEENNERHTSPVKCGRNRCNCFNGNGSDGDDGENDAVSAADVSDFLKRLVMCATVNERNVLADTARVVAEKNKACKRKDDLMRLVMEGLMVVGYDVSICKSKWEKSPSFPAGEYEYVDVIVGGERLIIDINFRSEFEVARSTKTYKSILQTLPNIFVGKSDRLSKIICIISEAAKQSLKKKGMHIPPWRKAEYVQAKWLSPLTRLVTNSTTVTPPPTPITPVTSLVISNNLDPNQSPEPDSNSESSQSEMLFDMSDVSEEDVEVKENGKSISINPKKNLKIVTGLTSIMEEKP